MWGTAAAMSLAMAGCGARGPVYQRFVHRWGTYSVGEGMELRVSTLGMSQMRYELWHVPSKRVLVSDVGRDSRDWFFVWDDRGRLWGHWNSGGTMVWIPSKGGGLSKHRLSKGDPMLNDLPPEVSKHMPQWVK